MCADDSLYFACCFPFSSAIRAADLSHAIRAKLVKLDNVTIGQKPHQSNRLEYY